MNIRDQNIGISRTQSLAQSKISPSPVFGILIVISRFPFECKRNGTKCVSTNLRQGRRVPGLFLLDTPIANGCIYKSFKQYKKMTDLYLFGKID